MDKSTDTAHYQLLLETARIGWWEAYFTPGYFICSEYLVRLFGRTDARLSFEEFRMMIRADYRDRITYEFATIKTTDVYEQVFPISTRYGIQWIRSKLCRRTVDAAGNVEALGLLELMSSQEFSETRIGERAHINLLLSHFGSISRALSSFVNTDDLEGAILRVLSELLNSFDTEGRVYIMRYDPAGATWSCPYEVCSPGVESVRESLERISSDRLRWLTREIMALRPVAVSSLDELPAEAAGEKYFLTEENVRSVLLVPMNMKERVYGSLGIDIVGRERLWNPEDYRWLSSVANIISIYLELYLSEEKAKEERNRLDRLHRALDHSEKMLRNLYKNSPVGIELYDKDGRLIDINDKDMEIFGIASAEDCLGISLFENPNLPPEILESIRNRHPVSFRLNYPFNRVGGYFPSSREGSLDISTRVSMLYDSQGELTNYLLINVDNTEKTIAYNRIEEFENFFALVSEFAKVGYAKFDLLSHRGTAIAQWYRNLGEKEGTPLDRIIGIYSQVHEEDAEVMNYFFERVRRNEADSIRKELRIRAGDGWRWTRVNVMRNPQNTDPSKLELICINYDITELKRNQEERRKAEELDRLKLAFLANMSHEIRTPLNAIVGFSSLLTETDSREEQVQFMEIIQKNNDLLLNLISDILDLSKIEAGTLDFKFADEEIRSILEETVVSFRIKMPPGVEIRCAPSLPRMRFRCDRVRLTQVLSNFINNAIKYTSAGFIELNYEKKGDRILFSVTDTGEGMTPEVRAHVFDRFYKGDSFKQGTGLGLSICETIVRRLGGDIGVRSEVGKGSTFWFDLPLETGRTGG